MLDRPAELGIGDDLPRRFRRRVTTQNLKIVSIDEDRGLILVKGAVPGAEGGWVMVRDAVKRGAPEGIPFPAGLKSKPESAEAPPAEAAPEAAAPEAAAEEKRSEEHTSELQSLMRLQYAVF